jgi:hypothetical protein
MQEISFVSLFHLFQLCNMQNSRPPLSSSSSSTAKASRSFQDFKLISAAGQEQHHVMQLSNRNFNVKSSFVPPLSLVRFQPPPRLPYDKKLEEQKSSAEFDAVRRDGRGRVEGMGIRREGGGGYIWMHSLSSKSVACFFPHSSLQSKVAPVGQAMPKKNLFKKKTKSYFFGRDDEAPIE